MAQKERKMDNKREFERLVEPPPINDGTAALLERLLFVERPPEVRADVVFVFGTRKHVVDAADCVRGLLRQNAAPSVILSGGSPRYHDSPAHYSAESVEVLRAVGAGGYPKVRFVTEGLSRNTLENVSFAVRDCGLAQHRVIAYVCVYGHAARARMTLRRFVPHSQLIPVPYFATSGHSVALRPRSWRETETGRALVWAEYLRIRQYGRRGDIALGDESDIVAEIERQTS
jgi:uncharacterized SAM-binding protein YcdF (DUF218 family)